METSDILIIGGGVIGCSLARELARANQKVVVLERGWPARSGESPVEELTPFKPTRRVPV